MPNGSRCVAIGCKIPSETPHDAKGANMADKIKITIITGYLGAGKTTLLNHILTNTEGIKAAVIVNDIGEVNIDAELIADTGAVAEVDDSLIPMTNGCICCTLSEDLAAQLTDICNSGKYDHIIIEASGVCEPAPIAMTIQQFCEDGEGLDAPMEIDNIVAVVDCARMFDEFNGGRDLVSDDLEEDDVESLLVSQIEFCSMLIMNKADLVTPEQMAELKALVRGLQKKAKIVEAERGNVPLDLLLDTGLYDLDSVIMSATWADAMENVEGAPEGEPEEHEHHEHDHHHEHHHDHEGEHHHGPGCTCGHCHDEGHDHVAEFGISTFVYERRKAVNREKLSILTENWPDSIIRCKGMLWFSDDDAVRVVFEQAGRQFYAMECNYWTAAAPEEEQKEVFKEFPEILDAWDPVVGDRYVKLVVIGRHMDHAAVEAALDACLED